MSYTHVPDPRLLGITNKSQLSSPLNLDILNVVLQEAITN